METLRAFLAIPLPDTIVDTARHLQKDLARALPEVRWTNPDSLHLTLRFFPALPEETLEKIGRIMLSVGRLFPPFPIRVAGLGTFPAPERARVFWLGIEGGTALRQLHGAFDEQFEAIGIPREDRPFTPHLTLGRRRQGMAVPRSIPRQHETTDCGSFLADRVILFQSRLEPAGAVHTPLRVVMLAGPPATVAD